MVYRYVGVGGVVYVVKTCVQRHTGVDRSEAHECFFEHRFFLFILNDMVIASSSIASSSIASSSIASCGIAGRSAGSIATLVDL